MTLSPDRLDLMHEARNKQVCRDLDHLPILGLIVVGYFGLIDVVASACYFRACRGLWPGDYRAYLPLARTPTPAEASR